MVKAHQVSRAARVVRQVTYPHSMKEFVRAHGSNNLIVREGVYARQLRGYVVGMDDRRKLEKQEAVLVS